MATLAIDFGTQRTRLAVFDRRRRQPVVRTDVPTVAYVPRSGPILVGRAAEEAIAADPVGTIDELKKRMTGDEFLRNRRSCPPVDLIALTLAEARSLALEKGDANDPLTDCSLTVALHFDLRQCELLQAAARRAGFTTICLVHEPVAAARHYERAQAISGNVLVVCDLGQTARIAVLRRPANVWRPDLEILPSAVNRTDTSLPRLLFDGLRGVAAELKRRGLAEAPLLVVGGGARAEGVDGTLKQEGWPGEVLVAQDPEVAIVLGAVDVPSGADVIACPECNFQSVPKIALACPDCGFPRRLFPDRQETQRDSTNVASARTASNSNAISKTCPECAAPVPQNARTCGNCGYPLYKHQ